MGMAVEFFFFVCKMSFILGWVLTVVMVGGGDIFFWVILVVKNWCLWLSFGCVSLPEK